MNAVDFFLSKYDCNQAHGATIHSIFKLQLDSLYFHIMFVIFPHYIYYVYIICYVIFPHYVQIHNLGPTIMVIIPFSRLPVISFWSRIC